MRKRIGLIIQRQIGIVQEQLQQFLLFLRIVLHRYSDLPDKLSQSMNIQTPQGRIDTHRAYPLQPYFPSDFLRGSDLRVIVFG